ncbi:hypothetical protein HBB16_02335 [Pseudonocardia sp. MCCB 268]|nr:hypothetical protein [Pseudonocardia cytotoxica]
MVALRPMTGHVNPPSRAAPAALPGPGVMAWSTCRARTGRRHDHAINLMTVRSCPRQNRTSPDLTSSAMTNWGSMTSVSTAAGVGHGHRPASRLASLSTDVGGGNRVQLDAGRRDHRRS